MELINTIDIIGLSQGILLGTLILINKASSQKAYTYLGLYLIMIGMSAIGSVLESRGVYEAFPSLYFLPLNFYFAFPILLYLYTREISGFAKEGITWKLFIPGMLEFLLWSGMFASSLLGLTINIESDGFLIVEGLYVLSALSFMIHFLIRIIRFITKVKKYAENNFSTLTNKTLSWLRIGCALILLTFLFPLSEMFMDQEIGEWFFYVETIINTTMIFWLAIHGYKQTVIHNLQRPEDSQITPILSANESEPKVIPLEGDRKRFDEMAELVQEKALYKRQELALSELAEEAGVHPKQLSFLINQFSGKNFFNFINEYRVREAQELLVDESYKHLSFLGIAFEAGFNSKATFNATFKKVTGQTPRQYKTSRQSA